MISTRTLHRSVTADMSRYGYHKMCIPNNATRGMVHNNANGIHASLQGGGGATQLWLSSMSPAGHGISFQSTLSANQKITISRSAVIRQGLTYDCWLKLKSPSIQATPGSLFRPGINAVFQMFTEKSGDSSGIVYIQDANSVNQTVSSVPVNVWCHIAVTVKNQTMEVYANGLKIYTNTSMGNWTIYSNSIVVIGSGPIASNGTTDAFVQGSYRVFPQYFTSQQIKRLYVNSRSGSVRGDWTLFRNASGHPWLSSVISRRSVR